MRGKHLLMDLYGCKPVFVTQDVGFLQDVLRSVIALAEMTLIFMPQPVIYEDFDSTFGWGVSATAILAESHVAIHTAPSVMNSVFFDMYSCKDFDDSILYSKVVDFFNPDFLECRVIPRNRFLQMSRGGMVYGDYQRHGCEERYCGFAGEDGNFTGENRGDREAVC